MRRQMWGPTQLDTPNILAGRSHLHIVALGTNIYVKCCFASGIKFPRDGGHNNISPSNNGERGQPFFFVLTLLSANKMGQFSCY